jgi:hypothetical protein
MLWLNCLGWASVWKASGFVGLKVLGDWDCGDCVCQSALQVIFNQGDETMSLVDRSRASRVLRGNPNSHANFGVTSLKQCQVKVS